MLKGPLSGLRSVDLEAHQAGCSPYRFDRCPSQSSLAEVAFASSQADDGSRLRVPARELARAGIVVGDTVGKDIAAGDIAAGTDTATPDSVGAEGFDCTVLVQPSKVRYRTEDIG